MSKYYNGSCANQVMRKNDNPANVSGVDAAEECNRLDKRIAELQDNLNDLFENPIASPEVAKRITELKAQLDSQKEAWDQHMQVSIGNCHYILKLETQLDAMRPYIQHSSECATVLHGSSEYCDCGLTAALDGEDDG